MRLISFRIRNFRSIVDSGFCFLAQDNITALIGQNESGKTTVLEALKGFSDGDILADMLRSDLSLPSVSCGFSLNDEEITSISLNMRIPDTIRKVFQSGKEVILTRSWNEDLSNRLELDGKMMLELYREHADIAEKEDHFLLQQVDDTILGFSQVESEVLELNKDLARTRSTLLALEEKTKTIVRSIEKSKIQEKKDQFKLDLDRVKLNADQEKNRSEMLEHMILEKSGKISETHNKVFFAHLVKEANTKFLESSRQMKLVDDEFLQSSKDLNIAAGCRKRARIKKLAQLQARLDEAKRNNKLTREEFLFNKKLASRIFAGSDPETARIETMQELTGFIDYPTREEIASELEKYLPDFELFEDFSSLLPNRIDLDDMLNENTASEGYKAARNFLAIAGLDAQFFRQQDNRILKQKIEKLSGEITINFQDYWRQSVGKKNKIKIHFELEHHDISHTEKKGKPYIEFWIKDEKERLYPKQRSRGVRWFLSFYLELKASAKISKREKILLIDEPGLSLHARAQEDVLKVFEDIRDQLMIIYTTHSPHLIDIHKLYRILAIQRAIEDDETSQTFILDVHSLMNASADTLSPIYTLMGARITDQQYIHKNNNAIVENATSFFLIKSFFTLLDERKEAWFLPAASISNVELLANLLIGWKLDFIIVLNDNEIGKSTYLDIKRNLFGNNDEIASRKLVTVGNGKCMIDLFSTIDFKNFLLKKRIGITETNSEFIEINEISSSIIAMDFNNRVQEKKIRLDDLDQETQENIRSFIRKVVNLLE